MRINGAEYLSASDLAQELGISRQTLWRWRQDGKIPKGYRFRDNSILFTRRGSHPHPRIRNENRTCKCCFSDVQARQAIQWIR